MWAKWKCTLTRSRQLYSLCVCHHILYSSLKAISSYRHIHTKYFSPLTCLSRDRMKNWQASRTEMGSRTPTNPFSVHVNLWTKYKRRFPLCLCWRQLIFVEATVSTISSVPYMRSHCFCCCLVETIELFSCFLTIFRLLFNEKSEFMKQQLLELAEIRGNIQLEKSWRWKRRRPHK